MVSIRSTSASWSRSTWRSAYATHRLGLNLYVASGITKMGISELTVAVMPWLIAMIGFMLLITYVPSISLWLPRLPGY